MKPIGQPIIFKKHTKSNYPIIVRDVRVWPCLALTNLNTVREGEIKRKDVKVLQDQQVKISMGRNVYFDNSNPNEMIKTKIGSFTFAFKELSLSSIKNFITCILTCIT